MKTYTHKPLALARQKLGLSLDDMIRELYTKHQFKVSSSTLESWERGETHPDADNLPPLLAVLKLNLNDLYESSNA